MVIYLVLIALIVIFNEIKGRIAYERYMSNIPTGDAELHSFNHAYIAEKIFIEVSILSLIFLLTLMF